MEIPYIESPDQVDQSPHQTTTCPRSSRVATNPFERWFKDDLTPL